MPYKLFWWSNRGQRPSGDVNNPRISTSEEYSVENSKEEGSLTTSFQDQMVKHPMGEQVQLGSLYDATTGTLFSGLSLWNSKILRNNQKIEEIPDTQLKFSSSLKETRKNNELDLEASLGLDVGLLKVTGAAKYLSKTTANRKEARVDVTCIKVNRSRYIPMEVLMKTSYIKSFLARNSNSTHVVSRVVEGGVGNISFVRKCSSSEEAAKVSELLSGQLKTLININAEGRRRRDNLSFDNKDGFQIEVTGAINSPISTFKDAVKIIPELPKMLESYNNTISMTLLRIGYLDSRHRRIVRSLDEKLLQNISNLLDRASETAFSIRELQEGEHIALFPDLKTQNINFALSFDECLREFQKLIRDHLPQMKDNSPSSVETINCGMQKVTHQTILGEVFLDKKEKEKVKLMDTVKTLEDTDFENFLIDENESGSLLNKSREIKIVLNLAGMELGDEHHFLEKQLHEIFVINAPPKQSLGWFEKTGNVSLVQQSYDEICRLKSCNSKSQIGNLRYGFGSYRRAYSRRDCKKQVATSIGDIIMVVEDKEYIITGHMPYPPCNITGSVHLQTITISWSFSPDIIFPAKFFHVRWRLKTSDGETSDGKVTNVRWQYQKLDMRFTNFSITSYEGQSLKPRASYYIQVATECEIGFSHFGPTPPLEVITEKEPSLAQRLTDFFSKNKDKLGPDRIKHRHGLQEINDLEDRNGRKPWEIVDDTLYSGFTSVSGYRSAAPGYENHLEYLIVDVFPEFEPDILIAEPGDDKARVLMFVGEQKSGKSSEINSLVSYLFDADSSDSHKIRLMDERNNSQLLSGGKLCEGATKYVTVYRIRPLTEKFEGNTFYLVDTPGFQQDDAHTKFMHESFTKLFRFLPKVNAIVMICRTNGFETITLHKLTETISHFITPTVQAGRLMTIMPFRSKRHVTSLEKRLKELKWPLPQNSVLSLDMTNEPATSWQEKSHIQAKILNLLLSTEPVSTDQNLQKFYNRNEILRNSSEIEFQMFTLVGESLNRLLTIWAISEAIENPSKKLMHVPKLITKFNFSPGGGNTTICIDCNYDCHENCGIPDGASIELCDAMQGRNKCTVCPQKCHWTRHKNSRFRMQTSIEVEVFSCDNFFRRCNDTTKTFEGAAVRTIDQFIYMQVKILHRIGLLIENAEKLDKKALRGDHSALDEYFEKFLKTAGARGATRKELDLLKAAQKEFLQKNISYCESSSSAEIKKILTDLVKEIRSMLTKNSQIQRENRAQEKMEVAEFLQDFAERLDSQMQRDSDLVFQKIKDRLQNAAARPASGKALIDLLDEILKSRCLDWSDLSKSQTW